MNVFYYTIISLVGVCAILSVLLYIVAQKFKVFEDPRIDEVEHMLPSSNCGGCGYAGCRNFAEALVKADNISKMFCPVGGNTSMGNIANFLGKVAEPKAPMVAVLRCGGTPECRPHTNVYDGVTSCAIVNALYMGQAGCPSGCLGCGDCEKVCKFHALAINTTTKLPHINDEKCTACGACAKACPRNIIELRKKNSKDRKIYVSCVNKELAYMATANCTNACTGCGNCATVCTFSAITVNNNLAYIDSDKCKLCRKCVTECPSNAIREIGFPARKTQTKLVAEEVEVA
jgi:Na+-translocating ferredoxin:NAD+ oxidoreductase RNF subunit RnfB